MAGVSTKQIKNRIRSMESTKQITKAMEMVATSKLRKAQTRALQARPYFESLYATIHEIAGADRELDSPYLAERPVKKSAFIVIAGDRGLAGGYNSNVLKLSQAQMEGKDPLIVPVGKKSVEFFKRQGCELLTESYAEADSVSVGDCFSLAKNLCKRYLAGEVDEIFIGYTDFVSVLSQTPAVRKLLPITAEPGTGASAQMLYEPDRETVLRTIVPEYLGGVIYGCLCESRASEQAARRTAMDAATQNADEMIADLSLKFNRARQAAITQEITEIVAGS